MATHAAAHANAGQAPPTLAADLALIGTLSLEHVQAFCGVARQLLRAPEDPATFRKAARQLSVDIVAVEAAVRGLCYVMVSASIAGRAPDDLLQGLPIQLSAESTEALISFYKEEAAELERVCTALVPLARARTFRPSASPARLPLIIYPSAPLPVFPPCLVKELRCGLALPEYRGVDWRLQVQLGGRYVARRAPQPSFLLRLHTNGGAGPSEHLLRADLPNMRRLASELECALREDKSSHSRRIARRL